MRIREEARNMCWLPASANDYTGGWTITEGAKDCADRALSKRAECGL